MSSFERALEARTTKDALAEREATLQAVIDTAPDIICLIDSSNRPVMVSNAFEHTLGYELEALLDSSSQGAPLLSHSNAVWLSRFVERARMTDATIETRARVRRADGEWVWLDLRSRGLDEAPGHLEGAVLIVAREITAQVKLQEKLERASLEAETARHQADDANRAKGDFLSRMSHELRTPLNATLGFAQLLEMHLEPGEHRDNAHQIVKAGHHLLELINEVLDISGIDAGRIAISPEPIHLGESLTEALSLVQPLTERRAIKLTSPSSESCDHHVLADRQRLRQVLLNLLSNAIKYNRTDGSVSVFCEEIEDRQVRIHVEDTGIGIPQDKMSFLFAPFHRLGAEQSGIEGTGLGLALAKKLSEVMGGSIGVRSVLGTGSDFWLDLPLAESQVTRLERIAEDLSAGRGTGTSRTILSIEDNFSNMKLMQRILDYRPEIKLMAALQGGLGLELASLHSPDLVLLDLHLPDMNGDEVLARLQGDESTRSIPVIVISADATRHQIERLMASGASAYLTKPLDVRSFLQLVDVTLDHEHEREKHGLDA